MITTLKGIVAKEQRERIAGAAISGLRHHHLTSSFVSHSAVILIGRYFSTWSLFLRPSAFSPQGSSRVPLTTCYSSINLSVLLDFHHVRLHCSLLLFS